MYRKKRDIFIPLLILSPKKADDKTAGDPPVMPVCVVGGLADTYIPLLPENIQRLLCSPKKNAQRGAISYFSKVGRESDGIKGGAE